MNSTNLIKKSKISNKKRALSNVPVFAYGKSFSEIVGFRTRFIFRRKLNLREKCR